ncbi:YdcF family protein [Chelatococcus sp. SYSU_G07232]|uniref:YdcF family protein n=1 Tax=Chelatococcus albus TaxID=3047466 RepID=A0ABT7ACZ4_9HYPH|nr:YdcF family protein [Chelatococcus sp. SYSU_G07232]MDJ1157246.1 YdcF family protein [Chelatococcus sp. SYSU_G07232]
MFFHLSKIIWYVTSPSNFLTLLLVGGTALLFTRYPRAGRALVAVAGVSLALLGATSLPRILLRPLEDRFPIFAEDGRPVDGIIVLGGAIGLARDQVRFTDAASRMTSAIELARRYPEARVVFTGGHTNVVTRVDYTEADAARRLFRSLGLDDARVIYESHSRNTWENARLTRQLVAPRRGERWLLVTSAYHMPRSMGIFRAIGFPVVPYPVDFHTEGKPGDFLRPFRTWSEGWRLADIGIKEWVGLAVYRLMGYTDALLPGPRP